MGLPNARCTLRPTFAPADASAENSVDTDDRYFEAGLQPLLVMKRRAASTSQPTNGPEFPTCESDTRRMLHCSSASSGYVNEYFAAPLVTRFSPSDMPNEKPPVIPSGNLNSGPRPISVLRLTPSCSDGVRLTAVGCSTPLTSRV